MAPRPIFVYLVQQKESDEKTKPSPKFTLKIWFIHTDSPQSHITCT